MTRAMGPHVLGPGPDIPLRSGPRVWRRAPGATNLVLQYDSPNTSAARASEAADLRRVPAGLPAGVSRAAVRYGGRMHAVAGGPEGMPRELRARGLPSVRSSVSVAREAYLRVSRIREVPVLSRPLSTRAPLRPPSRSSHAPRYAYPVHRLPRPSGARPRRSFAALRWRATADPRRVRGIRSVVRSAEDFLRGDAARRSVRVAS